MIKKIKSRLNVSKEGVVIPMNVIVLLRTVIYYELTNGGERNIQYFALHVKSQVLAPLPPGFYAYELNYTNIINHWESCEQDCREDWY